MNNKNLKTFLKKKNCLQFLFYDTMYHVNNIVDILFILSEILFIILMTLNKLL